MPVRDNPMIYARGQITRLLKLIENEINSEKEDIDLLRINLLKAIDSWRLTELPKSKAAENNYIKTRIAQLIADKKLIIKDNKVTLIKET